MNVVNPVLASLLAELHDDPAALAELRALLGAGPSVYTPQTLAAELGLTPRAVRAAIERGDLQARRSGRGYVIGAGAAAAWASPCRETPVGAGREASSATRRDGRARR